jgi:hypothetical protein
LTDVKASLAPSSKNRATATAVLIDMCRAATLTHAGSELRTLAASLQGTLRDQYFKRLLKVSDEDLPLLIDYLVAAFNLNPAATIKEQFAECLRNEQPQLRMVLVKSLLNIFKHRTHLHADAQFETTNELAPLVKQLFTVRLFASLRALTAAERVGQLPRLRHIARQCGQEGAEAEREVAAGHADLGPADQARQHRARTVPAREERGP